MDVQEENLSQFVYLQVLNHVSVNQSNTKACGGSKSWHKTWITIDLMVICPPSTMVFTSVTANFSESLPQLMSSLVFVSHRLSRWGQSKSCGSNLYSTKNSCGEFVDSLEHGHGCRE